MSKKKYIGDFSYNSNPQMDGLWDTITGAFDKVVDKAQDSATTALASGADKLLNDQIAKLLGTGGTTGTTTTSAGGVTTTSVVLPGQTTTQTINQPMDQMTKYAIYGAGGLLGVMLLVMMFKGGNNQPMYIPYPQQQK